MARLRVMRMYRGWASDAAPACCEQIGRHPQHLGGRPHARYPDLGEADRGQAVVAFVGSARSAVDGDFQLMKGPRRKADRLTGGSVRRGCQPDPDRVGSVEAERHRRDPAVGSGLLGLQQRHVVGSDRVLQVDLDALPGGRRVGAAGPRRRGVAVDGVDAGDPPGCR